MNILVISELNQSSMNQIREFLGADELGVGYLSGSTDLSRKTFQKHSAIFSELGAFTLEYFDLDANFSAETFKALKRLNAIFLAPCDVAVLNKKLREREFARFLREYFYIGGKLIACGRSAFCLAGDIAMAKEFNEVPRIGAENGLGYLNGEVFPNYIAEDVFLRSRLSTLSTHSGGRVIYGLAPSAAIRFEKDKTSFHGKVSRFFQGEVQEMHEGSGT